MSVYLVTTADDIKMGNGCVKIEAETASEAAAKYGPLRAVDYFADEPETHVGDKTVILVRGGLNPVEKFTTEYV